MKTLILLAMFLLPGDMTHAHEHPEWMLLNCEDYEFLTEDIDDIGMEPRIVAEIKIELIKATDPACFE